MADIIRKYSAAECIEFRERIIRDEFSPTVSKMFSAHPLLNSATMFVAQYHCDEAYDAVHFELAYSFAHNPDIAQYAKRRSEREFEDDFDEHLLWLMEGAEGAAALKWDPVIHNPILNDECINSWDENDQIISYFAAFTAENGSQEETFAENYLPYAIFQRDGKNVKSTVVGKMVRPYLDGIPTEYEQELENEARATTASFARRPGKAPGFWARLFGKKNF